MSSTAHKPVHEWPRSEVQSLLFDRDLFTPAKAKAWAKAHGYKASDLDTTDRYYRLRQFDANGHPCRTITFNAESGVKAIVCMTPNPVGDRVEAVRGPARGLRGEVIAETARVAQVRFDRGGRGHVERGDLRTIRNPAPDAYDWPFVADLVNDLAHRVTYRWAPSTNKVFISDIYDLAVEEGRDSGIGMEEFKRVLLELQRQGLVSMARADLVGAMDPVRVDRSSIDDGRGEYHFVLDRRR